MSEGTCVTVFPLRSKYNYQELFSSSTILWALVSKHESLVL